MRLSTSACAPESCVVTESEAFKSSRGLALARLGRNVLHFQRLEAQLKFLVLFCEFQSPLAQFAANHKKRVEEVRNKTMGVVVNELHERLYGKPLDLPTTMAITEASLTIGFRVDADPNYLNREKQRLHDLVTERNRLIHHDLADFDTCSEENCRHWITRLDEQNERILIQLKVTQQLVDRCKRAFQGMLAAMDSDEWKRGFKS